jgi:DNA-binding transcriptional MerR regulator
MKINEVSKKTGLSISTIRFYEKQDLIPAKYVRRDSNNYRNYSADVIDHLLMIKTDYSKRLTIYSSLEPCPMCTGAILFSNSKKVV